MNMIPVRTQVVIEKPIKQPICKQKKMKIKQKKGKVAWDKRLRGGFITN